MRRGRRALVIAAAAAVHEARAVVIVCRDAWGVERVKLSVLVLGRSQQETRSVAERGIQPNVADYRCSFNARENALDLFVDLAKAQPFEDGNKRTAVFVANSLLIGSNAGVLLTIPVDDNDPSLAVMFHDRLARAYIYGEGDGVKKLLCDRGLTRFRLQSKKELGTDLAPQ